MPIYVYRCKYCGHEFDELAKYEDPAPTCPKCECATERQISSSNFVLKGDGFYKPAAQGSDE